jgi:hypothetical protein
VKYQPKYRESWALVIGINKYRHVSPLEIARADAESIRDVLVRRLQFPAKNITMLVDARATRARIMEKFLSYENLDPDDRLIVFFAGHGSTVNARRGPIGHLIPVDGNPDDKSTLIRWDDLTRNADIIPAKHILFIMDACYSGLAIHRSGKAGERRFVTDMLQRASRQVIAAGKADETVADGGGPSGANSIFTGYLLQGIEGAAADDGGVITASNLMNFAYKKVATDSRSQQTPHFGHIDGDGDFILLLPDADASGVPRPDFLVSSPTERPEPPAHIDWNAPTANFLQRSGYSDPEAPSFGRNEWSEKLGSYEWNNGNTIRQSAFGWLALVVEPVSNEPVTLDLPGLAKALPNQRIKRSGNDDVFQFPSQAITTAKSLVLFEPDHGRGGDDVECWERFMRIERSGAIEFCDYDRVARPVKLRDDDKMIYPVFLYVQLTGMIWTCVYAARHILDSVGYASGVQYTVNLVGTKNSLLADFAHTAGAEGKKWADPFDPGNFGRGDQLTRLRCRDANLQFPFRLVIGTITDAEIGKIVWDCAEQFGLAYNHQSKPRCFNYGTDEFPWRQYGSRQ